MEAEEISLTERETVKKEVELRELKVSPFVFIEVPSREEADEIIWECARKSDREILRELKDSEEKKYWFMDSYWKEKGVPYEQIEVAVGERKITIYNYNRELPLTNRHLQELSELLKIFSQRYPKALENVKYILIDNIQEESVWGDEEKFPYNGEGFQQWQVIKIAPRGMRFIPHRIASISNFKGTVAHEIAHNIANEVEGDWSRRFGWEYCLDHENWVFAEQRGRMFIWRNKRTQEEVLFGRFTTKPELCLNDYCRIKPNEDIADSLIAALFDEEALNRVSPEKLEFLKSKLLITERQSTEVTFSRIPEGKVALPTLPKKTIKYYKEPGKAVTIISIRKPAKK